MGFLNVEILEKAVLRFIEGEDCGLCGRIVRCYSGGWWHVEDVCVVHGF